MRIMIVDTRRFTTSITVVDDTEDKVYSELFENLGFTDISLKVYSLYNSMLIDKVMVDTNGYGKGIYDILVGLIDSERLVELKGIHKFY